MTDCDCGRTHCSICATQDAAAEILALRGRVARLEEALRKMWNGGFASDESCFWCEALILMDDAQHRPGCPWLIVRAVVTDIDPDYSALMLEQYGAAAVLAEGKEPTSFSVAPDSENAPIMDRPEAAPAKCGTCRDSGWWQNPKYADNPQAGLERCPACTKPADAGRT